MKKIKILLADDHRLLRMGLATLIASERDMEVIGEAENGREAIELARTLRPDIVIMDLMMPEMSGAEATKTIHAELPDVKIMILTTFGTSNEMIDALSNGASGALMKDTATEDLVDSIRAIVAGREVIPSKLRHLVRERSSAVKLSDRHLEILAAVSKGFSNADIARQFGLSEITVKKHLSAIFEKLGVANRAEAVAIAISKQLVKM